jgi:hypothetical protein
MKISRLVDIEQWAESFLAGTNSLEKDVSFSARVGKKLKTVTVPGSKDYRGEKLANLMAIIAERLLLDNPEDKVGFVKKMARLLTMPTASHSHIHTVGRYETLHRAFNYLVVIRGEAKAVEGDDDVPPLAMTQSGRLFRVAKTPSEDMKAGLLVNAVGVGAGTGAERRDEFIGEIRGLCGTTRVTLS